MKLSDLLKYNEIVIQCHDNPDADALSSGYAVYWYLKKMGKKPKFIYRGINKIRKSNLLIMIKELNVPVKYVPDFDKVPELLVLVDCQYGQKNVTTTRANNLAVIDHHRVAGILPEMSEVRSSMGSCATVIWDMLRQEGVNVNENRNLSTALYYGLFTDTNKLSEVSHPLDRDMIDTLDVNKSLIKEMSSSNITLDELKITGTAIIGSEYSDRNRFLIMEAEPCDPIILGVISDFSMETENVDACIAFYSTPAEIKFSVRSCVKEVHANELAEFIADDIGGGGGHLYKAGGVLWPERLPDIESIRDFIRERVESYFDLYEVIYAEKTLMDTSDMRLYEKQPQPLGTLKMDEVFPVGTLVEIRTMEGDISARIGEDTYLMIGMEGEVYPISEEKLKKSYKFTGKPFEGIFEYDPSIRNMESEERMNVMKFAKEVISSGGSRIYAKPLTRYVKLFTRWDEEKYYSGNPGDYIAVRSDDLHDMYIIRGRLFDKLYTEVEEAE